MPHVIVKLYAGRTAEQKQRLADEVTAALKSALGSADASISVSVQDVDPKNWAEQVYKPDIIDGPGELLKKPGYNPFE